MDIEQFAARLDALRVVPVVTIDDARDAAGLAAALTGGGLPIAEITFRTDAAAEAIAAIRAAQPALLVGAGTVLDVATADRALAAGAEFIVAPGLNPSVVEHCLARGVAVIPGVATPTEIEAALAMSIGLMKFFPAEAMGGVRYLSAFAAPYRGIRFMPTGGINPATWPRTSRWPTWLRVAGRGSPARRQSASSAGMRSRGWPLKPSRSPAGRAPSG